MPTRIAIIAIFCGFSQLMAAIELPAVIADGMVLQRQATVPIWGWAKAGDAVSVRFADQTVASTVEPDGSWRDPFRPTIQPGNFASEDEMLAAARQNFRDGGTFLKVMVGGGVASEFIAIGLLDAPPQVQPLNGLRLLAGPSQKTNGCSTKARPRPSWAVILPDEEAARGPLIVAFIRDYACHLRRHGNRPRS